LNCVVCLQHASATVTPTSASTMKKWRPTSPVSTSTARCPGAESARTVGTTRRASTVSSVVTASTGRSTFRWIHRTSADVRILYHAHTRQRRQAPSWLARDHVSPPPSCCKFAHVTHPQRTTCFTAIIQVNLRYLAPPVKILLVQSFTAHMPLLMATSTFVLWRRRWSSPQQFSLHCLPTLLLACYTSTTCLVINSPRY